MSPCESRAATRRDAVEASLVRAAKIAGRRRDAITLVAISKTRTVEEIVPMIMLGQRDFGENRVQEAQGKWPALQAAHAGLSLHLVGQLQSNKAEEAVALFDWIHSVDRLSLITALARAQDKLGRRPRCFVQVNVGDEAQKGGCAVANVAATVAAATTAGLDIAGLMAVPPANVEAAPYFALLAKRARDNGLAGLSMGMSDDAETAIMLGATHVRIGTALFGDRR
jgi:PLP dependent protein